MATTALPDRVASMTWEYDWLGNMQSWDDDASAFYERSLGDIVDGADITTPSEARRTGALYVATNLPASPDPMGSADQGGWVELRYGEDGNVLEMTVHARCSAPAINSLPTECREGIARAGTPAEAVALSCAWSCASEQHYTYAWDEVNRIAEARRYDRDRTEGAASWELAVQQRYLYDSANQRTVKTTTFRDEEVSTSRTALYVYPGDFERRGLTTGFGQDGAEYQAIPGETETQYVVGGARIVWRTPAVDGMGLDRDHRITIGLTDLIQSTTAVLDLATGELVETGSYYANGARETYRANENGDRVATEPMGFTGKEADEEVGLTYFGQRYLMSHLGRWASPDPLQTHAVSGGEALNGYHYVGARMLQSQDATGLDPDLIDLLVSGNPYVQWDLSLAPDGTLVQHAEGAGLRPYVPNETSGVTVGPGYDATAAGFDADQVREDMARAGISRSVTQTMVGSLTLRGSEAQAYLTAHPPSTISMDSSRALYDIRAPRMDSRIVIPRITGSPSLSEEYRAERPVTAERFESAHPRVRELIRALAWNSGLFGRERATASADALAASDDPLVQLAALREFVVAEADVRAPVRASRIAFIDAASAEIRADRDFEATIREWASQPLTPVGEPDAATADDE